MFIKLTKYGLEMTPYWSILDFYVICILFKCTWHWFCSFEKLFTRCYVSFFFATTCFRLLTETVNFCICCFARPIRSVRKQF